MVVATMATTSAAAALNRFVALQSTDCRTVIVIAAASVLMHVQLDTLNGHRQGRSMQKSSLPHVQDD